MKKFISIAVMMLLFIPIIPVQAKETEINDMDINVSLDKEGTATITEVWDMYIDEDEGGTEVYKVMSNMENKDISNFTVKDDTGKKYKNVGDWDVDLDFEDKAYTCGILDDGGYQYELCFGISKYGKRTYTFSYEVDNFVEQYNECQGINFALFSDIELNIEHAKVTLEYPKHEFTSDNSRIWAYGYEGTVLFEDGEVVLETETALESGYNKMQLLMKIDDETFENLLANDLDFTEVEEDANTGSSYDLDYDEEYGEEEFYDEDDWDDDLDWYGDYGFNDDSSGADGVFLIFFFIIVIGGFISMFSSTTKDSDKSDKVLQDGSAYVKPKLEDVEPEFDVPCNGDIYRFFYFATEGKLISEEKRGGLLSAVLLKWILNKEAEYTDLGESGLIFKHKDYSIDIHPFNFDNLYEERIYHFFEEAAGSNGLLERNEFENYCVKHYEEVESLFKEILRYEKTKLIDEGSIIVTYKNPNNKNKRTYVYTDDYMNEFRHVLSFYKYLNKMTYIDEKEVEEVYMWDEYLIFAAVVDLAEKVYKQLGVLYPQYQQDPYYTNYYYHCYMMHSMCFHGVSGGYTAHHSSSSGFSSGGFGGGSSFGGGGGGFSGGGGGGVR